MPTIVRNKLMCRGAPTLEGRRLTVFNVVTQVAMEGSEIISNDMDLSEAEIKLCLQYCNDLACVRGASNLPFCGGCRLALEPVHKIAASAEDFMMTGDPVALGLTAAPDDYAHDISLTWLVAAEQLRKLS